jgi:Na+-driven multidrug efflux pump
VFKNRQILLGPVLGFLACLYCFWVPKALSAILQRETVQDVTQFLIYVAPALLTYSISMTLERLTAKINQNKKAVYVAEATASLL